MSRFIKKDEILTKSVRNKLKQLTHQHEDKGEHNAENN